MAHMLRQHFRGRRLSRPKANLKPDLIDWIHDPHLIRKGEGAPSARCLRLHPASIALGPCLAFTVQTGAKVAAPTARSPR